mmetsp:Transcript_53665/g.125066  ORF Transcript_53665/g.125066 Transcript_53665/m.125066 type:complete len:308 (-) Transcript_53665:1096-2019(-)
MNASVLPKIVSGVRDSGKFTVDVTVVTRIVTYSRAHSSAAATGIQKLAERHRPQSLHVSAVVQGKVRLIVHEHPIQSWHVPLLVWVLAPAIPHVYEASLIPTLWAIKASAKIGLDETAELTIPALEFPHLVLVPCFTCPHVDSTTVLVALLRIQTETRGGFDLAGCWSPHPKLVVVAAVAGPHVYKPTQFSPAARIQTQPVPMLDHEWFDIIHDILHLSLCFAACLQTSEVRKRHIVLVCALIACLGQVQAQVVASNFIRAPLFLPKVSGFKELSTKRLAMLGARASLRRSYAKLKQACICGIDLLA